MLDEFGSQKPRKGGALLLVTFSVVPMIGFIGLVTDLGYMHFLQKSAQAAADSAALAAVYRFNRTMAGSSFSCSTAWMCNQPSKRCPPDLTAASNPVETACLYAKVNGFSTSTPKQNVTIESQTTPHVPTAPGVSSVGWWITVRVTQTVPQLFSAILGNSTGTVAARASAVVQPGLGCVYALDPIAAGAYYQNGATTFQSACGIYVNSSDPSAAMKGNGGAVLAASMINVVGGVEWQGSISPPPNTGVTPIDDPLSYLQPPSPCSSTTGCDAASCSAHPNTVVVNSNTTLYPGVYCGGIKVKSGTATFSSGQYILVGGGISTQDTNSHIVGSGVLFYNTYNSSNVYKPIQFNANSDVRIDAPTTGDYAGVLVMQDRGCCTSIPTESFQGGATSFFEGIIYAPRSLVQFAGNPSLDIAHYTIVIARRFAVQGTGTMNNDFSHLIGGNPLKQVGLVE
jgi:hypothetical protein